MIERVAQETGASHIVEFVERTLGGTVVAVERIPRWRAGWYLTVDRDDALVPLYARGERGPDFASPFDLEHEARVHDLLEANGVPVPHVYGLAEGPVRALIMDRVPGEQGLALARDDATRRALMTTYLSFTNARLRTAIYFGIPNFSGSSKTRSHRSRFILDRSQRTDGKKRLYRFTTRCSQLKGKQWEKQSKQRVIKLRSAN